MADTKDAVLEQSLGRVRARIGDIYGKRAVDVQALCCEYAQLAKRILQEKQGLEQNNGYYWTNRTSMAIKSARGFTDSGPDYAGWGLAHTVEYGRWLELANNRIHAALEPTVRELAPVFMKKVRKIYGE